MDHTMTSDPSARVISVRKLVALDLIFHGPAFIIAEFACGVVVCGSLGAVMAYLGLFWRPHHASLLLAVPGWWLLGLALNATPLLLHALSLVRRGTARTEVAAELAHPERYRRQYSRQSALFIVTPGALLILAIVQNRRSRRGTAAVGTSAGTGT